MAYLPLNTIRYNNQQDPAVILEQMKQRGFYAEILMNNEPTSRISDDGWLFVADLDSLSKLLNKNADLLDEYGWTAVPYQENPFTITDSGVTIGQKYELSFLEFGLFVSQVLSGGWFGWDKDRGMPKEAKTTLAKLRQIW